MKKIIFSVALILCFISMAYSGIDGIPGCDGGTNPSHDGKFYLPETQQECNPSSEDLKKLKSVDYSYKNIAECAKLLPQNGKQYSVYFSSIVDKHRVSTGVLTITDDSKKELSNKEKAEVKPYSDCVKKFIK